MTQARVELFDVTGRRVAAEDLSASRFQDWTVRAPRSGVYFLRVQGDDWESSRKMVVLER